MHIFIIYEYLFQIFHPNMDGFFGYLFDYAF